MLRAALSSAAATAALALAVLSPVTASAATTAPAEDHRPVATNQTVSTPQDTPISITLSATDEDGDALTYAYLDFSGCHCHVFNGASSGTLPNVVFTPTAGFQGAATIMFQANDGQLSSNTGPQSSWGVVTINVTAPVATTPPAPTPTPTPPVPTPTPTPPVSTPTPTPTPPVTTPPSNPSTTTMPTKLTQCIRGGWKAYGFRSQTTCLLYVAWHFFRH